MHPYLGVLPDIRPRPAVGKGVQLPADVGEHGAGAERLLAVPAGRRLEPGAAAHGRGVRDGDLED